MAQQAHVGQHVLFTTSTSGIARPFHVHQHFLPTVTVGRLGRHGLHLARLLAEPGASQALADPTLNVRRHAFPPDVALQDLEDLGRTAVPGEHSHVRLHEGPLPPGEGRGSLASRNNYQPLITNRALQQPIFVEPIAHGLLAEERLQTGVEPLVGMPPAPKTFPLKRGHLFLVTTDLLGPLRTQLALVQLAKLRLRTGHL